MHIWKYSLAALLLAAPGATQAAPNAFWTFGFDLPAHEGRAPRFGETAAEQRYADASPAGLVPSAGVAVGAPQPLGVAPIGSIALVSGSAPHAGSAFMSRVRFQLLR